MANWSVSTTGDAGNTGAFFQNSGGAWTIAVASNVVTVNLGVAHGFTNGETIETGPAWTVNTFMADLTGKVVTVTGANTFTFPLTQGNQGATTETNVAAKLYSPLATTAAGLSAMSANDTLWFGDGIYTWGTGALTGLKNGTGGNYTILRAVNPYVFDTTNLARGSLGGWVIRAASGQTIIRLPNNSEYIHIDGFEADGQSTSSYIFEGDSTNGVGRTEAIRGEHIKLTNFYGHHMGQNISGLKPQVRYGLYQNFEIGYWGTGNTNGHGMYLGEWDRDSIFEYFYLYNDNAHGEHGIQNHSSAGSPQNWDNIYRYGRIKDTRASGISLFTGSQRCVAHHILTIDTGGAGINIGGGAEDCFSYNNIAYDSNSGTAAMANSKASSTIKNCAAFVGPGTAPVAFSSVACTKSNNLGASAGDITVLGTADKYFTDPSSDDFTHKVSEFTNSGGAWTVTVSSNVVTVNLGSAHGLTISGFKIFTNDQWAASTFMRSLEDKVITVTGANTFTFPLTQGNQGATTETDTDAKFIIVSNLINAGASTGFLDHLGNGVKGSALDIGIIELDFADYFAPPVPDSPPQFLHNSPYAVIAGVWGGLDGLTITSENSNVLTITVVSAGNAILRATPTTNVTIGSTNP